MSRETVFSVTQAVLALVVVVGSGVLLALDVVSAELVSGLVGAVLGYYFGTATAPGPLNGANRQQKDPT